MCDTYGWESVFYLFGLLGIVWFLFWAWIVADSPNRCVAFISFISISICPWRPIGPLVMKLKLDNFRIDLAPDYYVLE